MSKRPDSAASAKAERDARRAAELRANLARRKQQARAKVQLQDAAGHSPAETKLSRDE